MKFRHDRFSDNLPVDWVQVITELPQLRICDPVELKAQRTAHVVLSNKRKQYGVI